MQKTIVVVSFLIVAAVALAVSASDSSATKQATPTTSTSSSSASTTSSSSSSKPYLSSSIQQRQSPTSMISAIASLLPGLVTNVAPLLLLVGLGALVAPALGVGALGLLRESRRSFNEYTAPFQLANNLARPFQSSPQEMYYFSKRSLNSNGPGNLNFAGLNLNLKDGVRFLSERLIQALDEADKKY